mmetsp:Transcript_31421/g.56974  ORF Transcript_31421/g.56974 Transcript_31421/m.56974 type:complete len:716 (+) Transcript_31421:74-2221(+)|eukprot:CAMPEP_0197632386 /NCGR_PEP_ID=MMETSP1338-20131121/9160_1 /TAXON_ID=43686 ORGANISM="Pelagodinium beii, Strain RCC1491" /NCGR_SAMPLE_ID=MMETSP1338 /ASSEMBLY_ACC=CAM_ASM_000754 /LENGTH=715 /DNA_ID=CAMNT_0043203949 /DNA_START=61 /DNA_END=2208 /DNA_ORIENTATION=-
MSQLLMLAQPLQFLQGVTKQQQDAIQILVAKHFGNETFGAEFDTSAHFSQTPTERGLNHWEHQHLVAALDVLNAYQRNRRARSPSRLPLLGRPGLRRQFCDDPRTCLVEMLKRWLRAKAASSLEEEEVRKVGALCRDVLNHSSLFQARNPRSFLRTVAEVHSHIQWQLRDVLERDRTCAELAARALSLSRNLISDVVAYLLLGPTHLRQLDALPSLETVAVWQALPSGPSHPMPSRLDTDLQAATKEAWKTHCGSLAAAALSTSWAVRLFHGHSEDEELETNTVPLLIRRAEEDFSKRNFRMSGLAGSLRLPAAEDARKRYLKSFEIIFDLTYLLGEVLLNFHRIGDGLGDYGMIRTSIWLHPFLDALSEKVLKLKQNLEVLSQDVDEALVLAPARGKPAEKPLPSDQMCARGHEALQRSISGREGHAQALQQVLEELKTRSAPERLPCVRESLGDACLQLQAVFASREFRERVGSDAFSALPAIIESVDQLTAFPLESDESISPTEASPRAAPDASEAPNLGSAEGFAQCPLQENPAAERPMALEDISKATADESVTGCDKAEKPNTEPLQDALTQRGLNALVWRLVSDLRGFRRHDARMLSITDRSLHIFHRSSSLWVKTVVCVDEDVVEHSLLQGGLVLAIFLRRPKAKFKFGQDSKELKLYFFEFPSSELAVEFKKALGEEKNFEAARSKPEGSSRWLAACMRWPQQTRRK